MGSAVGERLGGRGDFAGQFGDQTFEVPNHFHAIRYAKSQQRVVRFQKSGDGGPLDIVHGEHRLKRRIDCVSLCGRHCSIPRVRKSSGRAGVAAHAWEISAACRHS